MTNLYTIFVNAVWICIILKDVVSASLSTWVSFIIFIHFLYSNVSTFYTFLELAKYLYIFCGIIVESQFSIKQTLLSIKLSSFSISNQFQIASVCCCCNLREVKCFLRLLSCFRNLLIFNLLVALAISSPEEF